MPIDNLHIESVSPLTSPAHMRDELPRSEKANSTVENARNAIQDILSGKSNRIFAVTGPCSVHNGEEAIEYASKLSALSREVEDRIMILMRVYFEKPRTALGWKGLIYDPDLDGSYNIEKGLRLARRILLEINEMGLAAGSEILDPVTPQYISDLISWAAIGARTSESQTHRQLASGLSMPVGFKNTTDGSIRVAVDAVKTAAAQHSFIGITAEGRSGVFTTTGNKFCHIVLRGGGPEQTNYEAEHIAYARELMNRQGLAPRIMIDCSHANSGKVPEKQAAVMKNGAVQIREGETAIKGLMLESNLKAGSQDIGAGLDITPGLSITDGCLGWEETESLIREVYDILAG